MLGFCVFRILSFGVLFIDYDCDCMFYLLIAILFVSLCFYMLFLVGVTGGVGVRLNLVLTCFN